MTLYARFLMLPTAMLLMHSMARGYPKSHFGSLRFLKMKNDQARNWQKTSEKRFEFMTKRG